MDEPAFTPEESALLDRIAREVLRRRLEVPAIFLLEGTKPLGFMGSQLMHFFSPVVGAFTGGPTWDALARLLEKRGAAEALIRRIEAGTQPPDDPGPDDGTSGPR
jgi:hypothetical protein